MSKHTPGPWTAEEASNEGEFRNIYGSNNRPVCAMYIGDHYRDEPDAEDWANARVVVEAPDMLVLLKQALPIIDAHRRNSGGEGDVVAMNIRALLTKIEARQ